jgi:Bromodomain
MRPQLSIFEYEESDFIVPLSLYVSRLRQLESVLSRPRSEHVVDVFYANEEREEDGVFTIYPAKIERFDDRTADMNDPNLKGSGYRTLDVVWDDESIDVDSFSPWEVSVRSRNSHALAPERPKLSEDEKQRVRDAISQIKNMASIETFFLHPVGPQYSDYLSRIEVPIDLTFIMNRLEADYYGSRFSVAADVRQIYSNSYKYNGDQDNVTSLACDMLLQFEKLVLEVDELYLFHKFNAPIIGSSLSPIASQVSAANTASTVEGGSGHTNSTSVVERRSQRRRQMPRSLLENLPDLQDVLHRPTRPTSSQQLQASNRNQRQTRANARTLSRQISRGGAVRTLEQLSSENGAQGDGTTKVLDGLYVDESTLICPKEHVKFLVDLFVKLVEATSMDLLILMTMRIVNEVVFR